MMGIIKKADIAYWVVLVIIIFVVYMFFSSGEFSVIFTLSGTVQTFGFALIVLKIRRSRSVSGLSRETFINYTLIFGLRTVLFVFFSVLLWLIKGIFAIRLIWKLHFQSSIANCNCSFSLHSLLYLGSFQI